MRNIILCAMLLIMGNVATAQTKLELASMIDTTYYVKKDLILHNRLKINTIPKHALEIRTNNKPVMSLNWESDTLKVTYGVTVTEAVRVFFDEVTKYGVYRIDSLETELAKVNNATNIYVLENTYILLSDISDIQDFEGYAMGSGLYSMEDYEKSREKVIITYKGGHQRIHYVGKPKRAALLSSWRNWIISQNN